MKTIKVTLIFLALAVLILFTSQSALADSEVAKITDLLTVSPNAPGTKVFGTLTIYFEQDNGSLCDSDPFNPKIKKMLFFVRLKKGNPPLYGYSSNVIPTASFCLQATPLQQQYLNDFFATVVIPEIFPKMPNANFLLKSVTQFVSDDQLLFPGSPLFAMMDIELAVQE